MKTVIIKAFVLSVLLLIATTSVLAQIENDLEMKSQSVEKAIADTLQVSGNCGMCKQKIEGALIGNPNIRSAVWNVESKSLVVNHTAGISVLEIMTLVAKAGYDTEKVKAADSDYSKLPGCCRYDR